MSDTISHCTHTCKPIFKVHSIRYSIDGAELKRQRKIAGIKSASFADKCGWSPTYQCMLENNTWDTVCESTVNVIMSVLNSMLVNSETQVSELTTSSRRDAL